MLYAVKIHECGNKLLGIDMSSTLILSRDGLLSVTGLSGSDLLAFDRDGINVYNKGAIKISWEKISDDKAS